MTEHRIVGPAFAGYTDADLDRVLAMTIEQQDTLEPEDAEYEQALSQARSAIEAEIKNRAASALAPLPTYDSIMRRVLA